MGRAVQVEQLLAGVRNTDGTPLASGQVYFYRAGSKEQLDVFSTATRSTTITQPQTLDAAGRALVYADGVYRVVVQDSEGATVYDWDDLRFLIGESVNWYGTMAFAQDSNYFANVYPAPTEYNKGDRYMLQVETINKPSPNTPTWRDKPTTVNINGLGEKNIIYDADDNDKYVLPWTFSSGQMLQLVYTGTAFAMVNADHAFWQNTALTYSAAGAMTVTRSESQTYEIYRVRSHDVMELYVAPKLTTAGTASEYISFSLPSYMEIEPNLATTGSYLRTSGWFGLETAANVRTPGFCLITDDGEFRIYRHDGGVFPIGAFHLGGIISFKFKEL